MVTCILCLIFLRHERSIGKIAKLELATLCVSSGIPKIGQFLVANNGLICFYVSFDSRA